VGGILITGNPGSGKTTIASHLVRRGFIAIDGDRFAGWQTSSGLAASQPDLVTDEWLASHRWVWDRTRLREFVHSHGRDARPTFVCGIAVNQGDLLDLFELVFLLSIDHDTQLERLNAADNADRNAAQRAQILDGRAVFEREMRQARAVVLDGRQPTSALVDEILEWLANG